ncbi:DNRLRE domain-containing protein, partial [Nonomuraea sp. NPDC050663]|uniref:DNRLRE domain-containing protein n=1 Tax=Nonomuraea sp. NPDC050663 TaxID=3364370 RepID=UPI0037B25D87
MVASLLAAAPAIAEPTPTPAPTGATASPDLVDAAKAEAKHTGKEVEIPSLHTENMTTVATPGGKTVKTYVSLAPVRAKRAGQWLDIDPTLIVADGVVKPKVTALDITLSNGGDGPLLTAKGDTLGDKDDPGEIVVAAPGKLPAPELSGSTATYRSAYGRNVDLVVTVTPDGYQHQIVIRDKPAKPLKLTVPIDPPSGMSLGKSSSGKPAALSDGKQVADLSTLPLIDAKEIVSPGSGKAGQVTTTVTGTGDKAALVLAPDAAFLADPAVTYPVTIAAGNPTPWHGAGAPADTFIANGGSYVNGSYMANDAAIFAGRRGGYNYRTYLKFNLTGAPFYGRQILDANIILWNYISHACGEVGGISMHRVAADWTPTGITWGNQPLAVADGHVINPYGKDANCSDWMAEGELWYSIEEIAQEWADMTPNRGLMIRSVNESSGTNWRQYLSGNYGGVDGHHPYFFLEYEAPSSPPEVIVYSYEGPKRTTLPTYEEALAMRVDTPGEIPYTPPMTESDLQALVARQNHVAEISPEELEPFTGESGEESWDGGTVEEGDPSDTTPPTVTSTVPAADERGVLTDTPIRATFSESVWEPEFLVTDPAGGKIEGSVTGDANGTTFTFAPAQPLKPGTRYTVRISEAIDAAANAVTAYQWSFETKADASGHWTFDEGSGGTAHDTSGKDHDAALNETASWNPGKSGNALTNTPSAATSQKSSPSRVISVAAAPTMSGFAVNPSQSVDGEIVTSSLTPELQVKVTDTGGRASKVDFQVVQGFSPYNTVWSGSVASAASGTVAKLAVGAGKLADGKEYYWQAKATAGTEASSWSSPQYVTVDVPEAVVDQFQVSPSRIVDGETISLSLTPSLLARVSDPLGGASKVDVQVVQGFSPFGTVWSGSVASVASGAQAAFQVPSGKLLDGKEYYWQVKATTPGSTPSWSSPQYVTVDVPEAVVDQFQVTPSRIVDGETISSSLTPTLLARVSDPLGGASKVDVQVVQGFSPFGTVWSG